MSESQEKDTKITALQAKIKYLEREISERVRSFLLRKPGKTLAPSTKTRGVQVQFNQETKQISTKVVFGESSLSNSEVKQFKKEEASTRHELTNTEKSELSDCVSNVWLAEVVGKLLDPQLEQRQSSMKRETSSTQSGTDIWKLKKKYARLQEKLKFQTEIATCAKEELLKSEEQNYKFRLKIQELTSQSPTKGNKGNGEVTQSDNLSQLSQKNAEIQQLKSSIDLLESQAKQLKGEIDSLKSTIASLQSELSKLKSTSEYELHEEIEALKKEVEQLKDLTYDISNSVPLEDQCDHHEYFRPQSLKEISSHLKRVSSFCKEIQKHEDQRLSQLKQEKQIFVRLVEKIKAQVSKDSRLSVWSMMKGDKQLAPYARIFYEEVEGSQTAEQFASSLLAVECINNGEEEISSSPTRSAKTSSPIPKIDDLFTKPQMTSVDQ